MDDDAIRAVVARLSRPHPSGGVVIERAAILAEGADFGAVITWIDGQGGSPESSVPPTSRRGLHGSRFDAGIGTEPRSPLRYVLPAGAVA